MVTDPRAALLTARGGRVRVRPVSIGDDAAFRVAAAASNERVGRWNAVDPGLVPLDVAAQSPARRTLMVVANDPAGGHGLVARINVTSVVRGAFQSASMGYDAYDPYAGKGLFREGLALVVGLVLRPESEGGMGLHRIEANVQPGNARSAGVLRSLGFRHEGETPQMLWLPGPDGWTWRHHERYAVTAPQWPAAPYAPHERARRVVLVNGLPGSGKSTLGAALAAELALPLLSKDVLKEAMGEQLPPDDVGRLSGSGSPLGAAAMEGIWSLLAHFPTGAVVENRWGAGSRGFVAAGLRRAGVEPSGVVEVWCDAPLALARRRYEARTRHAVHGPSADQPWWDEPDVRHAAPLGLGPVVRVDTRAPLTPADVCRAALAARAAPA